MTPRRQKLPDTTGQRHICTHGDCGRTDQCKFKRDKMSALGEGSGHKVYILGQVTCPGVVAQPKMEFVFHCVCFFVVLIFF